MLQQVTKRIQTQQSRYIALIVIALGLFLSGLGAYKVRNDESKKIQLTLQLRSLLISTTLQRSLRNNLESLDSIQRFLQTANNLSEEGFRQLTETEIANKPTIDSLSWVPRVPQQQRQAFEAQHRDRLPGIREISAQGNLQSAGDRDDYFPILFTTTDSAGENSLGFDLATSTTVANAMTQAQDTGKAIATLAVDDPNQNALDQLRLLVLIPVYNAATTPTSIPARRQSLSGFLTGELLIFNVVRGSFDELNMGGIDVFVTEDAESTRLLHVHKKRNGEYVEGSLQELDTTLETQNIYANTSLEVSGADWSLFFIPNANFFASQRSRQWIVVFIAGSLSTLLLGLYIKRQGDFNQATQTLLGQLEVKNQTLATALVDLKKTQTQAIQSEKLSSLGRLVGGIAHEINNPVNFISGNLAHIQANVTDLLQALQFYQGQSPAQPALPEEIDDLDIPFIEQDMPKALRSMQDGADRIRDVVLALRTFSRADESERKKVDLHTGLDSALVILEHRLNPQDNRPAIPVTKVYAGLPLVDCRPGEINQVFMHLLNNAIDALEGAWESGKWSPNNNSAPSDADSSSSSSHSSPQNGPQLWIYTEVNGDKSLSIRIVDNGQGMSEEVKSQLFDPFFSTKPIGQGSGLGLSISHQVIQRHGGTLTCNSYPSEKTEFVITLPTTMPNNAEATL